MARSCIMIILLIALTSAVVTSEASIGSDFSGKAEFEFGLNRLMNAIYPYRDEIRSTWTRRSTTAQDDSQGPISCNLCKAVMPLVRVMLVQELVSHDFLQSMVTTVCKVLALAPRPGIVCEPIIKAYTNQFLYIIANTSKTDDVTNPSAQICGLITPNCPHPGLGDWEVVIEGEKPPPVDREILPATGFPTTKIIQFTDLHVDLDYVEGTRTDCGKGMPICCREYEGVPENASLGAGPYGDFHCALPLNTLNLMFDDAKDRFPDARYIFLTGDYIHSGVWMYNEQENSRHVRAVTGALADAFPNKDIPIYPLVGNHEPHLVNMYPPEEVWGIDTFNISWLYHDVMQPFIDRDPNFLEPIELERFLKKGYYSVSPESGLRIIVLNTNLCSPENFWLGFNPYPIVRDQLQWLADELKISEDRGESVLIVGHIEPGSCWPAWSGKFNEVVDRFEGIIRGSFFGHSHKAQYRISMANGTMDPVFSSYIAGSGLPDLMNPAYSVFHVDGERRDESKWDVLRHELIILNLTESNSLKKPVFKKLADSYETFGMSNLSPDSVLDFAERLICNQTLMDLYLTFHSKGEDSFDIRSCPVTNSTCMSNILCNIVSSNAADQNSCEQLEKMIQETECGRATTTDNPTSTGGSTESGEPTPTGNPTPTGSTGSTTERSDAVKIRIGYQIIAYFVTLSLLTFGFAK